MASSNNVREKPWIILNLNAADLEDSLLRPTIGFRQIHVSIVNQTTHIKMGPSRAAQVAAKRYYSGRSAPPNAATYCIVVSFTRNLLARAKKGSIIHKWAKIDNGLLDLCKFGLTMRQVAAIAAIQIVAPHMFGAASVYWWVLLFDEYVVRPLPAEMFSSAITKREQYRDYSFCQQNRFPY